MNQESIQQITRPNPILLKSYLLHSILWGPAFPIYLIWKLIRYRTMRYRFDEEGVTMMWGRFSRREISVTYRTIQDIHLRSNVIERWLGLARVEIQTASGDAKAELALEGLLEFEAVREYLYRRMQLVKQMQGGFETKDYSAESAVMVDTLSPAVMIKLTAALQEVTAELRAVREALNEDKTHG